MTGICSEKNLSIKYIEKRTQRVIKITNVVVASNHEQFLFNLVKQPCCINWEMAVRLGCRVNGKGLTHARLYKFLERTSTSHGKVQIPISKIQVQLQEWKTPMITLLVFGYCVGEKISYQVGLSYGSRIRVKNTSFGFLRTKFEARLQIRGVEEGA